MEFTWVRGHSGVMENERCDQLSYAALKSQDLPEDTGYEQRQDQEEVKITQEGDLCRKCSTPVVRRIPRSKDLKPGQAYYAYYLYCPGCRTIYYVEDAKRYVDNLALF